MTRNTRLGALAALPVTILMAGAAMAQDSTSPAGPPSGDMGSSMSGGAPAGGASTLGTVDSSMTTTSTTTETFDGAAAPSLDDAAAPLPNTGGEPLLVAMLGSMAAMGAFAWRRKLS